MTTTQNRPPDGRPARKPFQDPVPQNLRKYRAIATWLAIVLMLISVFYLAWSFGQGHTNSAIAGLVMLVVAVVVALGAQQPGFYQWLQSAPKVKTPKAEKPAPEPARRRPSPRRREPEPAAVQVPELLPTPELGPDFRYILRFCRFLVVKGRADDVFHALNEHWNGVDWEPDPDFDGEDENGYRDSVILVRTIAQEHEHYDDGVTIEQLLDGTANPANPFGFLAELDEYSPAAGAVAALMLVRHDSDVTTEVFQAVMQPWVDLGLPYRLGDTIHEAGPDGEYQAKPASRTTRTRPPAAPAAAGAHMPPVVLPEPDRRPASAAAAPAPAPAAEPMPEWVKDHLPAPAPATAPDGVDLDVLVHATELVVTSQFGSMPMLQRKLRIGFATAGHVVDRLERYGVLGPDRGTSAREVMVQPDELAETLGFIKQEFAEGR